MIGYIIRKFKQRELTKQIRKAVEMATLLSNADHRKRLVLMVAGLPKVYTKQELKRLLLTNTFKRGTTIQGLEKMAITITQ
ncbi:MAG: hypothetical protein SNG79_01340 [Rikenellaceae bacterium]